MEKDVETLKSLETVKIYINTHQQTSTDGWIKIGQSEIDNGGYLFQGLVSTPTNVRLFKFITNLEVC